MKHLFFVAAFAGSSLLFGAENLPLSISGNWKTENPEKTVFSRTGTDGKINWAGLVLSAPVEAGTYYRFSYHAASSIDRKPAALLLNIMEIPGIPKKFESGFVFGGPYVAYFLPQSSGNVKITVNSGTKKAQTLTVSQIRLEKLVDADFKTNLASESPEFWNVPQQKYDENQESAFGPAKDAASPTGTAVQFKAHGVFSSPLPVVPGRKYAFSLWIKGSEAAPLLIRVCGYNSPHAGTHFYKDTNLALTTDYRQVKGTVEVPADLVKYPDLKQGTLRIRLIGPQQSAGMVSVAGVEFKEIQ